MNKINNIINFYLLATELKEKIRSGWILIGIEKERLESVAEHIYGCLILAIAINSEYKLDIDMYKVLKMLTLHELEEIIMGDLTIRSNVTKEEKKELGKKYVHEVVKDLCEAKEIEALLDEFNDYKTNESKFCYHIDKLECDFQAKVYDLQGAFSIENARTDLEYYGKEAERIEKVSKTASDYWIEYDRPIHEKDEIFKNLINNMQERTTLKIESQDE